MAKQKPTKRKSSKRKPTRAAATTVRVRHQKGRALGLPSELPDDTPVDPELRPHIISLQNNGRLKPDEPYGTSAADIARIVNEDIPRITRDWSKRRIMLYAHGGVVSARQAIEHAHKFFDQFLDAEVYPIFFIWRTDPITVFLFEIEDQLNQVKPKVLGLELEDAQEVLDDIAEGIAKKVIFKDQWDEMKENALLATTNKDGGARVVAQQLAELMLSDPNANTELHLVGHSAGGIFHAPLTQLLTSSGKIRSGPMKGQTGLGVPVSSCHLWAPGCTLDLFKQTYVPALHEHALNRLALYTLTDKVERADKCGEFYHKSILYLVSNALEDPPRVPPSPDGKPILGLMKFVQKDAEIAELFRTDFSEWIVATEKDPPERKAQSAARNHGGFDDDPITLRSTLARIQGKV